MGLEDILPHIVWKQPNGYFARQHTLVKKLRTYHPYKLTMQVEHEIWKIAQVCYIMSEGCFVMSWGEW